MDGILQTIKRVRAKFPEDKDLSDRDVLKRLAERDSVYTDLVDEYDTLDRMRGATQAQESGGRQKIINPDSGAGGLFQVMKANIRPWTKKHLGRSMSQREFLSDPDAQRRVFMGEMGKYYSKALKKTGGDREKAVRMSAAAWYGGEGNMHLYDNPRPQVTKGRKYPSFRKYTTSVWDRVRNADTNGGSDPREITTQSPSVDIEKQPTGPGELGLGEGVAAFSPEELAKAGPQPPNNQVPTQVPGEKLSPDLSAHEKLHQADPMDALHRDSEQTVEHVRPGGDGQRAGQPPVPEWLAGKSEPVSEFEDQSAERDYLDFLNKYGFADTEERRQRALTGIPLDLLELAFLEQFNKQPVEAWSPGSPAVGGGRNQPAVKVPPVSTDELGDLTVRIEPRFRPQGLSKGEDMFRQAIDLAGHQITGGEDLTGAQKDLLAAYMKEKKGGFSFESSADGDQSVSEEDLLGRDVTKYTLSKEMNSVFKQLLDVTKADLEKQAKEEIFTKLASGLDLGDGDYKRYQEYWGLDKSAVDTLLSSPEAKQYHDMAAANKTYRLTHYQKERRFSPELAISAAARDAGMLSEEEFQKHFAQEKKDERKHLADEENATGLKWIWRGSTEGVREIARYITDPLRRVAGNLADKAEQNLERFRNAEGISDVFEAMKSGAFNNFKAVSDGIQQAPPEFKTISSKAISDQRKAAALQRMEDIKTNFGSVGTYNRWMAEQALKYNQNSFPRQALFLMQNLAKNVLAEIPKTVAAIDAAAEKLNPMGFTIPKDYLPSLRTAGNVLSYLGATITGGQATFVGQDAPVSQRRAFKLAKWFEKQIGTDEYLSQTFSGEVNQGLASGLVFLAGGFALKGVKYGVGLMGSAMQIGSSYEELKAKGLTDNGALAGSFAIGIPSGFSEMWGIGGIAGRLSKLGSGLTESSLKTLMGQFFNYAKQNKQIFKRESLEEALQEFLQTDLGNAAMEALAIEDPNGFNTVQTFITEVAEQVPEASKNAAIGAIIGGPLGVGAANVQRLSERFRQPEKTATQDRSTTPGPSPSTPDLTPERVQEVDETIYRQVEAIGTGGRKAVVLPPKPSGELADIPPHVQTAVESGVLEVFEAPDMSQIVYDPELTSFEEVSAHVFDGTVHTLQGIVDDEKQISDEERVIVESKTEGAENQAVYAKESKAEEQKATLEEQYPESEVTIRKDVDQATQEIIDARESKTEPVTDSPVVDEVETKKAEKRAETIKRGTQNIESAKARIQEVTKGQPITKSDDAVKVLDEIQRIRNNQAQMPDQAEDPELIELEDDIKEMGLEVKDLAGQEYDPELKAVADIIDDPTIPEGTSVISRVKQPQIMKDGKIFRAAKITVAEGSKPKEKPVVAKGLDLETPAVKTPKTRGVEFKTFEEWDAGLRKLKSRRTSAKTYSQQGEHFGALADNAKKLFSRLETQEDIDRVSGRLKQIWHGVHNETRTQVFDDLSARANQLGTALKAGAEKTEAEQGYFDQAMDNLKMTSRTARGILDTSASKGKVGQIAVGAKKAAKLAISNFKTAFTGVYRGAKKGLTLKRIDAINKAVNKGIVKEGVFLRTEDSKKFPYTRIKDLEAARKQFNEELHIRLSDPKADPIETAAWIEWRVNLNDHFYADGVGKTAKLASYIPLIRAGLPLPKHRETSEFFAFSQKEPVKVVSGTNYLGRHWKRFLSYYRTLFDSPGLHDKPVMHTLEFDSRQKRLGDIQTKTQAEAIEHADLLYDNYIERFGSKVINPDIVKKLFPEYREDPLAAVQGVHEASSYLARYFFRKRLLDLPKGSRVVLMGGGAAAGKSFAIKSDKINIDGDLIYDSTLASVAGSKELVDLTIAAGHIPMVRYIFRDIELASRQNVIRSKKIGRIVPLTVFVNGHIESAAALKFLDGYTRAVGGDFDVIDNEWDKPQRINLEKLADLRYTNFDAARHAASIAAYEEYNKNPEEYDSRLPAALEGKPVRFRSKVDKPNAGKSPKRGPDADTGRVDRGPPKEPAKADTAGEQPKLAKKPPTKKAIKEWERRLKNARIAVDFAYDSAINDKGAKLERKEQELKDLQAEHSAWLAQYREPKALDEPISKSDTGKQDESSGGHEQARDPEGAERTSAKADGRRRVPRVGGTDLGEVSEDVLPDTDETTRVSGKEPGDTESGSVQKNVSKPGPPGSNAVRGKKDRRKRDDISAASRSRSSLGKRGVKRQSVTKVKKAKTNKAVPTTGNFYVKDVAKFQTGGLKQKFKNNITAIRTLRKIQAEGREVATVEEQEALAKYIGWGQFPALFNVYNEAGDKWKAEREELLGFVSPDEFESASASTKNAHFTHPEVVQKVWDIVTKLGFKGGRAVETSMGIGNFLYMMPESLRGNTRVTGIELDTLTASIGKLLFPKYDIREMGYEKFAPPAGYYDLAISNIPFGAYPVADKNMPYFLRERIHNYFFAKTIKNVRPGGLIAFITSTGTLDNSPDVVKHLAGKADLVTAMRFPADTFKGMAGTSVVTDLIVLRVKGENVADQLQEQVSTYRGQHEQLVADRKKEKEREEIDQVELARLDLAISAKSTELNNAQSELDSVIQFEANKWTKSAQVEDPDGGEVIDINEFYVANPDNILGRLDRSGSQYRGNEKSVSRQPDFEQHFNRVISNLPTNITLEPASVGAQTETLEAAPEDMRQGSFVIKDGKAFTREGSFLVERPMTEANLKKLEKLLEIRNTLNALATAEHSGNISRADTERAKLNKLYDAYRKAHGTIHDAHKLMSDDPDHYRLQSLEVWDKKAQQVAGKADIFRITTIALLDQAQRADNYGDALGSVLNRKGFVDTEEIAAMMGVEREQVETDLVEQGFAYNDPRDGWQVRALYLSGEVKRKLREAQEAAALDPAFDANVEELEKVQPADKPYRKIEPAIGAAWIPSSDIAQFMSDAMNEAGANTSVDDFQVAKLATGDWLVDMTSGKHTAQATEILGTNRRHFGQIVLAAIKDMPVTIYDTFSDGSRVVNKKESKRANKKVKDIKKRFKKWIWRDDERRQRLHRAFNDTYNDTIDTVWDGSHLTFPGLSRHFDPYPVKKNAIYRLITQGRGLFAHEVGTGKTSEMGIAAMELRRLKLAKKPAIVALNSNVGQVTEEIRELYPNAKILAANEGMSAKTRKQTTTRIMTGDWDIVILTHENMKAIPMSRERQLAFIREEVQILRDQVAQLKGEQGKDETNRVVKALEAKISRKTAKLESLFNKPVDDAITWEETGIDFLMVDEAHAFKNLDIYTTRAGTKGIPTSASQRATDLFMKTRYITETQNGRGVAFFTGTPISNTTAELFNMQRYLMYEDLKEKGIHHFDAWAANFGENETSQEMKPGGGMKYVTAFRKYKNLSTLRALTGPVLDVLYADDIPHIKRPKRIDNVIAVPMSDAQANYMDILNTRAERLKNNPPKRHEDNRGKDNWLVLGTHAVWSALDMRLLDPTAEDDPNSKVNTAVREILAINKKHKGKKTQLIFSDVGVNPTKPNPQISLLEVPEGAKSFNLYQEIIDKLVAGGIPRDKIINFSKLPAGNSDPKALAMARLNSGDALIAIGSTSKLGTGVNVQNKLIAIHKLDVKHRPDQDEQETGRGWRHGNENDVITINRYTTTDSFDMHFYEVLQKKTNFITSFLGGAEIDDNFTDQVDQSVTYDDVVALTASNPLIRERLEVMRELRDLNEEKEDHDEDQLFMRDAIARKRNAIKRLEGDVSDLELDQKEARERSTNSITVGDVTFEEIESPEVISARVSEELAIEKELLAAGYKKYGKKKPSLFDDEAEAAEKDLTKEEKAEIARETRDAKRALPTLNVSRADRLIQSTITFLKKKLGSDYQYRSKILYGGNDGYTDPIATMFGFPVRAQFRQTNNGKSISTQLWMEFPSGEKRVTVAGATLSARGNVNAAIDNGWKIKNLEKNIDTFTAEIPALESQLGGEYSKNAEIEGLNSKLARIETELGLGALLPDDYQAIDERVKELEKQKEAYQGIMDSYDWKDGDVDGQRWIVNNENAILSDYAGETAEAQKYQLSNVGQKISALDVEKAEQIYPFGIEVEFDSVVFDNAFETPAGIYYEIVRNHPDAYFVKHHEQVANVDQMFVYAISGQEAVAAVMATKGSYLGEELEPAIRTARVQGELKKRKQSEAGTKDLSKVIDENEEEFTVEDLKVLRNKPLLEVVQNTEVEQYADRLILNANSHELLRRTFEETLIREGTLKRGGTDVKDMFAANFMEPEAVKESISLLREKAKDAVAKGHPKRIAKAFTSHADALEAAAKDNGTVVLQVFANALPHELLHQADYLGAADKNIDARHTPRVARILDRMRLTGILWRNHFIKFGEYKRLSKQLRQAVLRAEIPALLMDMSAADLENKYGITEEERDDYMLTWFEGWADKNGIENLDRFYKEDLHVEKYTEKIKRAAAGPAESKSARDEDGADTQEQRQQEKQKERGPPSDTRKPEEVNEEAAGDPRTSRDRRYMSWPATARRHGIDAEDELYDVLHDPDAQLRAREIFDQGLDYAIAYWKGVKDPDTHDALLSGMIQKTLYNKADEVRLLDPARSAEYFKQARELGSEHGLKAVKAGRFTRAARITSGNMETVVYLAGKMIEEEFGKEAANNPETTQKLRDLARTAEEARALATSLRLRLNNAQAKVRRLQNKIDGKIPTRSKSSNKRRGQLAGAIREKKAEEIKDLRAELQAKLLKGGKIGNLNQVIPPRNLMAAISEPVLDKQTIEDLAKVGAMILNDRLEEEPKTFTPDDFHAELITEFGDSIKSHFDEIYKKAYETRNRWLDEIRTEKTKLRLNTKYAGTGNYSEDLTDAEIEQILGFEKEAGRLKRAIEKAHKLSSKAKIEARPLKQLVAYIEGQNAAPEITMVAVALARKVDPVLIRSGLKKDFAVTKERALQHALLKGRDLLRRSKIEMKAQHEELEAKMGPYLEEIRTLEEMGWEARTKIKNADNKIAQEFTWIRANLTKFGDIGYYGYQVWGVGNVMRSLMASGDLSGSGRQGLFFMLGDLGGSAYDMIANRFIRKDPKTVGYTKVTKNFGDMLKSFKEKGYGNVITEIERHPLFAQAQRHGVDFAVAGRDESDDFGQLGEESFRGAEQLRKIPGGTALSKITIDWSERTYTAFLDSQRMVYYAQFHEELAAGGYDTKIDKRDFVKIAKFVNISTGRGQISNKKWVRVIKELPFFAPRWLISRMQLLNITLNPVAYARMSSGTRKIVGRSAFRFYSTMSLILMIASQFVPISFDPDDSDFLKINLGSSKFDLFGGLLQPARVIIRIAHSGWRTSLGLQNRADWEFGRIVWKEVSRFFRGKLSPAMSFLADLFIYGEDYVGNEVKLTNPSSVGWAVGKRFIPLTLQDTVEASILDGPAGALVAIPALLGINPSTYESALEKPVTEAEKLAAKMVTFKIPWSSSKTEDKARYELKRKLKARSRKLENVKAEVEKGVKDGILTESDARTILAARTQTLLQEKSKRLSLADIEHVYRIATRNEKRDIQQIANRKMMNEDKAGKLKQSDRIRLNKSGIRIPGYIKMPDSVRQAFSEFKLRNKDVGEYITERVEDGPNIRYHLLPTDYADYRRKVLTAIYKAVTRAQRSPGFKKLSPEDKKAELQEVINDARRGPREELEDKYFQQ